MKIQAHKKCPEAFSNYNASNPSVLPTIFSGERDTWTKSREGHLATHINECLVINGPEVHKVAKQALMLTAIF